MDCMGKIARFLTVPLQDMQKQEPAKRSWRACNLAILLGHAGNVPDKIVFGCQSSLRGTEHVPLLFISFLMQNRTKLFEYLFSFSLQQTSYRDLSPIYMVLL